MFREMRRFGQQISTEECIQILKEQPRGVLSVLGDDDYPYGIPLDHWYCEENGKLYFHCAKTGHKLDAVRKLIRSATVYMTRASVKKVTGH